MQRYAYIEAVPQLLVASPAASRLAALKGPDPPELAACYHREHRLFDAVKALKRSVPLRPQTDISRI